MSSCARRGVSREESQRVQEGLFVEKINTGMLHCVVAWMVSHGLRDVTNRGRSAGCGKKCCGQAWVGEFAEVKR